MWYGISFGQLGSAVIVVFLPSFLCTLTLFTDRAAWEAEKVLWALLSNNYNILVLSTVFWSQIKTSTLPAIMMKINLIPAQISTGTESLTPFTNWDYVFLVYPFATSVTVEAVLVALVVLCTSQLLLNFGFPDASSTWFGAACKCSLFVCI